MGVTHTTRKMPVHPDTIVVAVLEDGTVLSAMKASEIDWNLPGDDVLSYDIIRESK